jgi:integrase
MIIDEWVFPGRRRNGKPIGNVNCWWTEIRSIAEAEDITIHDIRRTIASWMAMTGASYPIIAQLLGHTLPGATQIYARLSVEPVREQLQIAVDRILEVANNDSHQ